MVSADVAGSFRELVLFIQDDNILTRLGNSSGSSYNLRVEPPGSAGVHLPNFLMARSTATQRRRC